MPKVSLNGNFQSVFIQNIMYLLYSYILVCVECSNVTHLIRDIYLLSREFVVVSHLKIFPFPAIGFSAGPSSSKGKILRWDTFQISGGKHNCPYYMWNVIMYHLGSTHKPRGQPWGEGGGLNDPDLLGNQPFCSNDIIRT